MDFDLNNIKIEDHVKLDMAREKAIKDYVSNGYVLPTYAPTIIGDVYTQLFEKENNKAFKSNKDGVSEKIIEKMEFMKELTEVKLYNTLNSSFKKGEESVEFSFYRGIPDKQTADFFNLEDVAGVDINISRTSAIRLPKNLHCEKECTLTMTPQGDSICIDGRVFGAADPVATENFTNDCNVDPVQ